MTGAGVASSRSDRFWAVTTTSASWVAVSAWLDAAAAGGRGGGGDARTMAKAPEASCLAWKAVPARIRFSASCADMAPCTPAERAARTSSVR